MSSELSGARVYDVVVAGRGAAGLAVAGLRYWAAFGPALLDAARAHGVEVRERCTAVNVVIEGNG